MARLTVLAGVLVLLNLSDAALAQARLSGADLQGEVRDESGGLLVGATVTVVNKETNVGRKVETDERGQFRALDFSEVNAIFGRGAFPDDPQRDAQGRVTYGRFEQALPPRQVQLGLRLTF